VKKYTFSEIWVLKILFSLNFGDRNNKTKQKKVEVNFAWNATLL